MKRNLLIRNIQTSRCRRGQPTQCLRLLWFPPLWYIYPSQIQNQKRCWQYTHLFCSFLASTNFLNAGLGFGGGESRISGGGLGNLSRMLGWVDGPPLCITTCAPSTAALIVPSLRVGTGTAITWTEEIAAAARRNARESLICTMLNNEM